MKPYRYYVPTEIRFGAGCVNLLPELAGELRGSRPIIVTGSASARRTGLLDRLLTLLPGSVVFEGVEENPSDHTCDAAAAICRENKCDLIVAAGGGSPMDTAKAVALLATNPGRCAAYYGYELHKNRPLPLIAVPTTSGTGSECTQYAIITDTTQQAKCNISGRDLFPRFAVLDPELTYTMPRQVTLASGLDALSQGMEGFVSRNCTPPGDALALEVCRLVFQWLPVALDAPEHPEARAAMQHAAMLSGIVIAQSGTTLVHGAGYALTTRFGVTHGLANALLLPPVFQYNARYLPEKVAALANALGVTCEPEPKSAARAIGRALHAFYARLGFDCAGANHGIQLVVLRDEAVALARDPRRLSKQPGHPDAGEILAFYKSAHEGSLLEE